LLDLVTRTSAGKLFFHIEQTSGGSFAQTIPSTSGNCNSTGSGQYDTHEAEWVECKTPVLDPGNYRWRVVSSDHHDVFGKPSGWQYFEEISPTAKDCDQFAFTTLCDDGSGDPLPTKNMLGTDPVQGDSVAGSASAPPQSGTPIFSYTLLQNQAPNSAPLDTTNCRETPNVTAPAGGLSPVQANQVTTVHIDLSGFLEKAGGGVNGPGSTSGVATAQGSIQGAFDLRQRESSDYRFALGCEQ